MTPFEKTQNDKQDAENQQAVNLASERDQGKGLVCGEIIIYQFQSAFLALFRQGINLCVHVKGVQDISYKMSYTKQ